MTKKLAQLDLGRIGEDGGFGPWSWLGEESEISQAAGAFTKIISNIIGVMTLVAGIWFIFQFIIGAFGYLSAGGNPEAMKKASSKISGSLLGLLVVVLAYAFISLLSRLLGFEILQPQKVIELLGPG